MLAFTCADTYVKQKPSEMYSLEILIWHMLMQVNSDDPIHYNGHTFVFMILSVTKEFVIIFSGF